MTTKADINKTFRYLESFDYTVLSFGDNKPGRKGSAGGVDNILFNKKNLIFVETKTADTKDKLSEKQKNTAIKLSSIMAINKTVYYFQITDITQATKLVEDILTKKL